MLNSEIESLKSTVKDLNSCIKTQKQTNRIERETMNDIHLLTINVSTYAILVYLLSMHQCCIYLAIKLAKKNVI